MEEAPTTRRFRIFFTNDVHGTIDYCYFTTENSFFKYLDLGYTHAITVTKPLSCNSQSNSYSSLYNIWRNYNTENRILKWLRSIKATTVEFCEMVPIKKRIRDYTQLMGIFHIQELS